VTTNGVNHVLQTLMVVVDGALLSSSPLVSILQLLVALVQEHSPLIFLIVILVLLIMLLIFANLELMPFLPLNLLIVRSSMKSQPDLPLVSQPPPELQLLQLKLVIFPLIVFKPLTIWHVLNIAVTVTLLTQILSLSPNIVKMIVILTMMLVPLKFQLVVL